MPYTAGLEPINSFFGGFSLTYGVLTRKQPQTESTPKNPETFLIFYCFLICFFSLCRLVSFEVCFGSAI